MTARGEGGRPQAEGRGPRSRQRGQRLDHGRPASRPLRKQTAVLYATRAVSPCHGAPARKGALAECGPRRLVCFCAV